MRAKVWVLATLAVLVPLLSGCVDPGPEFQVRLRSFPAEAVPCESDADGPACQTAEFELENGPTELVLLADDWTAVTASGNTHTATSVSPDRVPANETATVVVEFQTGTGEQIDEVRYEHGGRTLQFTRPADGS